MSRASAATYLVAGIAILALGACSSGARKPDLSLPAAYEAPPGTSPLTSEALDRWWTIFSDPELDKLEEDALAFSPDAKTQIARLREAAATRTSDVLRTLPTGDLSGNASRKTTHQIGGDTSTLVPIGGVNVDESIDFNVSWELDFFGVLRDERRAARADYAANRFDVESARASLVANVADSYFQARGLAIQLEDAQETARIDAELLRVADAKASHGLGPSSDADQLAGELAQAQSVASGLEAELHAAQRLLLILVGRGIEPVEHLAVTADVPDPPAPPQAVPGDLLTRRPDVREADWKMRAAAIRTRLAREEIFPSLTLKPALGAARAVSPGVNLVSVAPLILAPGRQTESTAYWSYGVGMTAPVLDIPRMLEDARAQSERTEEAVIAYEQAVQNAYGDAENALVLLAADEVRVKLLTDGEARARRAYEAAMTRYKAGLDDLTSTLSAERTWRVGRLALTSERVQALRRAVQTYKALGGGWAYAA